LPETKVLQTGYLNAFEACSFGELPVSEQGTLKTFNFYYLLFLLYLFTARV
jgi:hypothetical protein